LAGQARLHPQPRPTRSSTGPPRISSGAAVALPDAAAKVWVQRQRAIAAGEGTAVAEIEIAFDRQPLIAATCASGADHH